MMPKTANLCAALSALMITLVWCPRASAQEDPPSAIEVQLRREIAALKDRLAASDERIRRLEAERDELRKQLAAARSARTEADAGSSSPDAGPQEARAPVPADPFASPASMLHELRKRYDAELGDLPHDTEPAIADYKKDVEAWCKAGVRDLRDRRQWLVKVSEIEPIASDRRNLTATIRVIDEATALPIGDPIKATIDASNARKIETAEDRFAYWRATVVISAAPAYNELRADAGVFEHPAFVGRYCDFGVQLDWRLFQGVRANQVQTTPPTPPSGG